MKHPVLSNTHTICFSIDRSQTHGKSIYIQVSDPYFGRESVRSNVEEILDRFRKQQFTITDSCDSWSKIMTEKREIEILWERTMSNNVQVIIMSVVSLPLVLTFTYPDRP